MDTFRSLVPIELVHRQGPVPSIKERRPAQL